MIKLLTKLRPLWLFLVVLTTACSSQTGQQPSAGSGSSSNLATVYFYRTQNSGGGGVGVDIKDNGLDIGTLQAATYFVYHTNPGQHLVIAATDSTSNQNFTFQAGATYYIEATVVSRQNLFQPSLSVVFDLQGQAAVQNLRRLKYHE